MAGLLRGQGEYSVLALFCQVFYCLLLFLVHSGDETPAGALLLSASGRTFVGTNTTIPTPGRLHRPETPGLNCATTEKVTP
jgi:hypothetical protein